MMRTAFGLSFLTLLALGAVGAACSSKATSGDNGGSGSVCDTYCNALAECDGSQSLAACLANCQVGYADDKLGSAFSGKVKDCLGDQNCDDYEGGGALDTCGNLAAAGVTESAAGSDFCDDLSSKLAECSLATSTTINETECTGRVRKYNDAAIARAAACLEGACETVLNCVNNAIPGSSPDGGGGSGNTGGASNTGGTGVGGGSAGTGVTGGTGGAAPACPIMCVDDQTASYCDETGTRQEANCAEEYAKDGLISLGCTADAEGTGCTLDDFSDVPCIDGAIPFAVCAAAPAQPTVDDVVNYYVGCFRNMNGAHTIIPCFAQYLSTGEGGAGGAGPDTAPTVDCEAAAAACLPAM